MWFSALVVAAAQIAYAYFYLEYMQAHYYQNCYGVPYPDGSFEVICYYTP